MRRLKGSRGGSKEEEVHRRRRFKGVIAGSGGISRDGPILCSWLGLRKLEELLKEKDTEG
jgi:hypothetical protein